MSVNQKLRRYFAAGEVIFRTGDPGDCAYIIHQGRVALLSADDTSEFRRLESGEICGEIALLDNQPRGGSAIALEPCELLILQREEIIGLVERADPTVRMVMDVLLRRLRNMNAYFCSRTGKTNPDARSGETVAVSNTIVPHAETVERLRLVRDLREALQTRQMHLVFQPVTCLSSGRVASFEALLRWSHPQRGFVSPADFIPLAEQTGLVMELDAMVCEMAVEQAAAMMDKMRSAGRVIPVAVNLTGFSLVDGSVVAILSDALRRFDVPPAAIRVEITEGTLISDPRRAARALEGLKEIGVHAAIDDFGTGYSSLASLASLPVDMLKIDRSFISEMTVDPRGRELVLAIIRLARALGLAVVAEGIEMPCQLSRLHEMECDYVQGFLLARPLMPAEAVELALEGPLVVDGRPARFSFAG